MAAKAQRGGYGDVDIPFDALVRNIVEVATFVRIVEVDGGGVERIADGERADHRFDDACGADAVAGHALGTRYLDFVGVFAEGNLEHLRFGEVVQVRGCAVGVVVVHVGRGDAGILQCLGHRFRADFSTRARARDVVGVGRRTVTGEFRINLCTASLGVFEFLNHEDGSAFAHHESGTVLVERTGGLFGGVVELVGEGVHARETLDGIVGDAAFGTAREAHVQTSGADRVQGDADGVRAGGACGADRPGGTRDAKCDRDVRAGFVRDEFWHGERRNAASAAFEVFVVRFFDDVHAGKTVTGDDSCGIGGDFFFREVRVGYRFVGGGDEELREAGHAAGFLGVDAVFFGFKFFDFCCNLDGAVCRIEQCDGSYAALACLDGVPKFRGGLAYGGDCSHAGNNDSSSVHIGFYSLLNLNGSF